MEVPQASAFPCVAEAKWVTALPQRLVGRVRWVASPWEAYRKWSVNRSHHQ